MWVDHSISSWPDRDGLVVGGGAEPGFGRASVLQGGAASGHPSPELRQAGWCESVVPIGYVLRRTKACRQLLTTKPRWPGLGGEARSRSRPSA